MRFAVGSATDQGQLRENNEDAFLADSERELYAVADGMGGHAGGEVASRTAIEALRAAVAAGTSLEAAIERANDAVLARAATDSALAGMGTTITALTPETGHQLLVGHVGDSRAYLLRNGALERVTEDHSLVEELVREGQLTPEQAESHPRRSIVTRALGVEPDVDVDTYIVNVLPNDRILLCSDGVTTMLREREVEAILRTERDPQHAADALVAAANEAGGEDNITAVVVDVLDVDDDAAAEAAAAASAAEAAAPAPPEEPPRPSRRERERARGSRLRTLRGAILVLLPLIVIVGVATAALGWYARKSYYVGVSGNEVVIYKGVPGGVLGWNPTVDERTGINVGALAPLDRDRVRTNASRGSLETTRGYVTQLQANVAATSSTTTTTLRPPGSTTPTTTRP